VLPTQRSKMSVPVVTLIFSSSVSCETNARARATAEAQSASPETVFAGATIGDTHSSNPAGAGSG
jgi:hypothetical protein